MIFVSRLLAFLKSRRFAIAAFLISLGIRTVPEILVGPYPVGWDTIAFYVPTTLDWATGNVSLGTILITSPLMYMISVPIYILTHANPVWIFKIMGPVSYGCMILALFRYLRAGLRWTDRMALGSALLTSLYFVTLRISWDLYRNMLGLTFILLSLPLFEDWRNSKNQVLLAGLTVLSVASDPLTGVISLGLIGARVLPAIAGRRLEEIAEMLKIGLPGAALFSAAKLITPGTGIVQSQTPFPTLVGLWSSVGFLGFAYSLFSPLIFLGLRKVQSLEIKNWSILCLGFIVLALMPLFGPNVPSYRWTLLLDIPLCVYASAGLARLSQHTWPSTRWVGMIHRQTLPIVSTLLVISAVLYIALPAQEALIYYTAAPGLLPTSMVQDTVPMSDLGNLRALLDAAASRIGPGIVLITHQAIYGWVRAYTPRIAGSVINYEYDSPLAGVDLAKSEGYSSVLMIWWINGLGGHGQENVPNGFVPVITEGNMALYAYYF